MKYYTTYVRRTEGAPFVPGDCIAKCESCGVDVHPFVRRMCLGTLSINDNDTAKIQWTVLCVKCAQEAKKMFDNLDKSN